MLPTAVVALLNQSCLLVYLQGTRDPLFLTGVTFPSEYPIYEETKIKLTVYDVKDKSHDTVSICLCLALGKGRIHAFHNLDFYVTDIFQRGYVFIVYACFIITVC